MDLSIIIVNYNSAPHVLNCVESIYKETTEHSFEIIVADNQSTDNSKEIILSQYKEIIWLQTGYNAGFARANNAGIRTAQGEYILLLNADTIVRDKALDKTIDLIKGNPDVIACGVQLLNTDGTHQISGAYFVKGGLNFLLPLPYLGRLIRYLGYKIKARVPGVHHVSGNLTVDWIVGAFLMVKKDILQHSGLLDEDFFMYAEEIEWCSRLRKYGRLVLFEEPKVIHLGGGVSSNYYATAENENHQNLWNKKGRQIIISQLLRIRKQYGILWFLFLCICFLVEIPVFAIGLIIEKIVKMGRSRYSWSDVKGYIKNVAVLFRYFFRIIMNKPFFYKVY
jgi:GT2 family glycosyltransferase